MVDEERLAKLEEQRKHLMHAQEARLYMNDCVAACREELTLGVPPTKLHLSFDFAQQVIAFAVFCN